MGMEQALQDAQTALRNVERDVSSASWFNVTRFEKNRGEALAALGKLAGHAELAALQDRLTAAEAKAGELQVDSIKADIDNLVRAAKRDLDVFERSRTEGNPRSAKAAADKQTEWIKKVREALDAKRAQLATASGQAYIAQLEGWFADGEAKLRELELLDDALAVFQESVEVETGELKFPTALESVERNLKSGNLERVMYAWDAAKKLVDKLRNPRFADIKEIKDALARYAALEARMVSEVYPKMAKTRGVDPTLDSKLQDILVEANQNVKRFDVEVAKAEAAKLGRSNIDSAERDLLRVVRRIEELGEQAKQIAADNAAVIEILQAAPRLRERAGVWATDMRRKHDYASSVEKAKLALQFAREARDSAKTSRPEYAIANSWPALFDSLGRFETSLAEVRQAATDHTEAEQLSAQATELRNEGMAAFKALCLREGTRLAMEGDDRSARRVADALKKLAPDASELPDLEQAIARGAVAPPAPVVQAPVEQAEKPTSSRGSYVQLDNRWSKLAAAAAANGNLYVIDDGLLYRVNPLDGSCQQMEETWKTRVLVGWGERLFSFEDDGTLYRIDAASGDYIELEGDWSKLTAATILGKHLYAVDNGSLYRVDPTTGAYDEVCDGWDTRHMVGVGDRLYMFEENGTLYRTTPEGEYKELNNDWRKTTAVATVADRLYATCDGTLYEIDTKTGDCTEVSDERFDTKALVGLGAHVFACERDGLIYRIEV